MRAGAKCTAQGRGTSLRVRVMTVFKVPRNMRIVTLLIVLCMIRLARTAESATGAPYVRLHGTWNKCGSDTRSCCESVQTRRIPCNTLGNPRIPSHAHQSHSKRRPWFDLNFPFLMLFLLQRPLQTPLMICQRSFETPLMVSQRPF